MDFENIRQIEYDLREEIISAIDKAQNKLKEVTDGHLWINGIITESYVHKKAKSGRKHEIEKILFTSINAKYLIT